MNWTDNVVMRFLGRGADFVILNLLWLVCSIPIITIGASTTALYTVMLKLVKNEEGYIAKGFLKAFRENLKKSTAIWLVYLFFSVVLIVDLLFVRFMAPGIQAALQAILLICYLVLISVGIYAFALQARYENTVKNTLKNALILTVARLPYTLLLLVITVGPVIVTLLTGQTLMMGLGIWIFIGVAVVVWLNSIVLRKVFVIFDTEENKAEA